MYRKFNIQFPKLRKDYRAFFKTPVEFPKLEGIDNMSDKWIELLRIAKRLAVPYTE